MKKLTTILLVAVLFIACKNNEPNHITGFADEFKNTTIYLKKYDHFNYLDEEYILDSIVVDEKGKFDFQISPNYPKFVTISKYKNPPGTYQVFKSSPQHFYYSLCSNFLAESPTIYLEDNKNYNINNWDTNQELNSVSFDDEPSNNLRKYYRSIDYRKDLRDGNRKRINTSKEVAWNLISKIRDEILVEYNLNQEFKENSFNQYFRTEVYLGAANEFLQWYSLGESKSYDSEFIKELMSNYKKENWHPSSLEYYKFNEHYVSYILNNTNNTNEVYFEPSEQKIQAAEDNINPNIKEIYLDNLKSLTQKT